MTEYELADLAMEAQGTVTAVFALFLTVLSGYLLVAWMVGKKLDRLQLVLLNTVFVGVQLVLIAGWSARWNWFWHYYNQAKALNLLAVPEASGTPIVVTVTMLLMLLSVLGSVMFMWNIRRDSEE